MSRTASLVVIAITACHAHATPLARFHDASGGDRWRHVVGIGTKARVAVGGLTGTLESIEDVRTGLHKTTTRLGAPVVGDGIDDHGSWELTANGLTTRLFHIAVDTPAGRRDRTLVLAETLP